MINLPGGRRARRSPRVPETDVLLDLNTPLGDAYWSLMDLAGDAGRGVGGSERWSSILGAAPKSFVRAAAWEMTR